MINNNAVRLGQLETQLLANWERIGQRDVTTSDVSAAIGAKNARDVIRRLIRSGLLVRIARGRYMTMPLRNLARQQAVSPLAALPSLLHNRRYYVGGRRAWTHHRLTQQMYISAIDVFVDRDLRPRTISGVFLEFRALSANLFDYGIEAVAIEGREIPISDVARTVLDALDYPKMFGDTETAIIQVNLAVGRADPETLIRYALRGSRIATCQRIGLLLERAGVAPETLLPLRVHVTTHGSLQALLPGRRRRGPINKTWSVIENDQGTLTDHA